MKSRIRTTLSLAALALVAASANAAVVFSDDFESPDVTAAQSDGYTSGAVPGGWVGATEGFGASRRGLVDEAHGDFTDPVGEQAFAFRYTNSGLTTAEGVIGTVATGVIITVSFDVVLDGHNSTTPYNAYVAAFDVGATNRNDVRPSASASQRTILATTSGDATGDGNYTTIDFSYVVGNDIPGGTFDPALLGKDFGLVFVGATDSAIIDNVSVDLTVIPEPGPVALLGLGGIGLVIRRRNR